MEKSILYLHNIDLFEQQGIWWWSALYSRWEGLELGWRDEGHRSAILSEGDSTLEQEGSLSTAYKQNTPENSNESSSVLV